MTGVLDTVRTELELGTDHDWHAGHCKDSESDTWDIYFTLLVDLDESRE